MNNLLKLNFMLKKLLFSFFMCSISCRIPIFIIRPKANGGGTYRD